MTYFTRYIALFLLLLFVRVQLPESLILALHTHTHTIERRLDHKFGSEQLDTQHIHCQTDQLFHNTFYTLPVAVVLLVNSTYTAIYSISQKAIWKFTFPNNIFLRGPPQLLYPVA